MGARTGKQFLAGLRCYDDHLMRLSKKSAPEKRAIENKRLFSREFEPSGIFRQSQRSRARAIRFPETTT